jgi:hypothetical protein
MSITRILCGSRTYYITYAGEAKSVWCGSDALQVCTHLDCRRAFCAECLPDSGRCPSCSSALEIVKRYICNFPTCDATGVFECDGCGCGWCGPHVKREARPLQRARAIICPTCDTLKDNPVELARRTAAR